MASGSLNFIRIGGPWPSLARLMAERGEPAASGLGPHSEPHPARWALQEPWGPCVELLGSTRLAPPEEGCRALSERHPDCPLLLCSQERDRSIWSASLFLAGRPLRQAQDALGPLPLAEQAQLWALACPHSCPELEAALRQARLCAERLRPLFLAAQASQTAPQIASLLRSSMSEPSLRGLSLCDAAALFDAPFPALAELSSAPERLGALRFVSARPLLTPLGERQTGALLTCPLWLEPAFQSAPQTLRAAQRVADFLLSRAPFEGRLALCERLMASKAGQRWLSGPLIERALSDETSLLHPPEGLGALLRILLAHPALDSDRLLRALLARLDLPPPRSERGLDALAHAAALLAPERAQTLRSEPRLRNFPSLLAALERLELERLCSGLHGASADRGARL